MVLGWVCVAVGAACLGVVAFALARHWTPQRWGGRYKHFALVITAAAFALVAQGVGNLTGGTVSALARLVTIAGFVLAGGGLLATHRADARERSNG